MRRTDPRSQEYTTHLCLDNDGGGLIAGAMNEPPEPQIAPDAGSSVGVDTCGFQLLMSRWLPAGKPQPPTRQRKCDLKRRFRDDHGKYLSS